MKRWLILLCLLLLPYLGAALAEETIIVDNNSVSICVTGFDQNLLSYNMAVTLENKTDQTLTFSLVDSTVNGVEVPVLWAAEVPANSKKKSAVSWYDLHSAGVEGDILAVQGTFRAYETENWVTAASCTFAVIPQEDNRIVIIDEENAADDDTVVVDDDRYLIKVDNFTNTSLFYVYGITITLENRTDMPAIFTVRDVTVNGKPCDPYWASELAAGEQKNETIGWFEDTFEENDIESVNEITMTFIAYETDDLYSENKFEQTVTLNP